MKSEPRINESSLTENPSTQIKLQTSKTGLESFSNTPQDQEIQRKAELQLYLHFQRMLEKSKYHYSKFTQKYFGKKVSKQQNVNETLKYLNYLKQNIKQLSPNHHYKQLLFLIDIFNNENLLITNWYFIHPDDKDSTGPAKFRLHFGGIDKRIDLKQLANLKNWNHLLELWFDGCGQVNNDDWRAFVENAGNFNNLKTVSFNKNQISAIREGDIEKFKSLKEIHLCNLLIKTLDDNPLSKQSEEVLKRLRQKNNKMRIYFYG